MSGISAKDISVPEQYSSPRGRSMQIAVWVSYIIVFTISILGIAGWIFNVSLLKSIGPQWVPMKVITSLCFIFSTSALVLIHSYSSAFLSISVSRTLALFILVVSLTTIAGYFYFIITGNEASISRQPVLNLFLPAEKRMELLTALIFLLISFILFLLSIKNKRTADIAHILFFPVASASYFIPISYFLGVYSMNNFSNGTVPLNTGISFCAFSIAILFLRTDTWLMKVFTSDRVGGIMSRKLLPPLLLLPLVIGWLKIEAERAGLFESALGVELVTITYSLCFVWLIWRTARSINQVEQRVTERTSELKLANEQLYKSRQEWIETFDLMPDLIAIIDTKHRILRVNKAMLDKLGVSAHETIGTPCYKCVHGTTSAPSYCPHTLTLFDGKQHIAEIHEDRLGGDFIVSNTPMFDNMGNLIGSVHVARDITGRKKAEEDMILAEKELERTKNYLESLINYANAPIIVWNTKKEIELFNRASEQLTGYSSAQVEGKKLSILFPKDALEESNEKIKHSLTENLETMEIPILTKSNEIRTVLWNSANIYDNGRNVLSTIAQGNDITERIKAELEAQKSREKLNLALENGNIGIWEWDIRTDTVEWDERMEKIFGLEPGSFEKTYDAFEKYIFDEDLPHMRYEFRLALEEDIPLDTIYRTRLKNDTISYISTKALVEKDNNGKPIKMSGVSLDITEMKKGTEKALFRLNENLLRSNKELEQFAYVASHDLQEPLRMVSSFTQLLSQRYKDKLDKDAQEFIQFAVDGANRMQVLINDLLEYSRIETRGKKFSVIDIHTVLGHAIKNLSLIIKEKNALVINDALPTVMADEGQMVQLFQNLIGNALKFCDTSPKIHISAKEETDHYLFKIKDNGIGMESQYFNKIFQIFQRLQPKEAYSGTGIGLAICKRIIERHGGKIWVESKPDKGSDFYFTIIK